MSVHAGTRNLVLETHYYLMLLIMYCLLELQKNYVSFFFKLFTSYLSEKQTITQLKPAMHRT